MNQDDGPAGAFDHKMEIRSFDVDELRLGLRMIARDAGRDVFLLESAGNAHVWWTLRGDNSPQRRRESKSREAKSEPRIFLDEHR